MVVEFLTIEEVIVLHKKNMAMFGGAGFAIRDKGLLESAVAQPKAMAFGNYLHETIYQMAAAYCFHIIKNHPFVDGNKRTGLLTALTFLKRNGVSIRADGRALYNIIIGIAESKISKEELALFFQNHVCYSA